MADQALSTAAGTDPHDGYLTAEDRRAIEDLVATCALSLDVDDVEQTLGLFTGDGEFCPRPGVHRSLIARMFETAQHGLHLTGRSMVKPHPGRAGGTDPAGLLPGRPQSAPPRDLRQDRGKDRRALALPAS